MKQSWVVDLEFDENGVMVTMMMMMMADDWFEANPIIY